MVWFPSTVTDHDCAGLLVRQGPVPPIARSQPAAVDVDEDTGQVTVWWGRTFHVDAGDCVEVVRATRDANAGRADGDLRFVLVAAAADGSAAAMTTVPLTDLAAAVRPRSVDGDPAASRADGHDRADEHPAAAASG